MEAERALRLELDPEKSRFHPANLLTTAINGIAAMEEFRQAGLPDPAPSPRVERMQAESEEREAEFDEWRSDVISLVAQQSRAGKDPEQFRGPYLRELSGYHDKRATKLGAHATALEVKRPKFTKIRKWFTEKKQNYHERRSRRASLDLLKWRLVEIEKLATQPV